LKFTPKKPYSFTIQSPFPYYKQTHIPQEIKQQLPEKMPSFSISTTVLTIAIVLLLARPAHAFGAGNIQATSKIEGSNCSSSFTFTFYRSKPQLLIRLPGRHGDIEDTLLTLVMARAAGGKKWDKMSVARTYFGNWLRDYCAYF